MAGVWPRESPSHGGCGRPPTRTGCRLMWGIVARFEDRASGDAELVAAWSAAKGPLDPGTDGRPRSVRLAVAANALALVRYDDDSDVHDLHRITADLGRRPVATLQEELLAAADTAAGRPLTTRLVRVLGERAWGDAARSADTLTGSSVELRSLCAAAALELLMVGYRDTGPAPSLTSRRELLEAFASGDVLLWRRLVAAALAEPWAGRVDGHLALLDRERRPSEFGSVHALAEMARRIAEEDERRAVADHIRTTIAATGLTQREFAALVGTSPSRLSTYVTGSVTPSAAMLLRINRMAKRARAAAAKAGGTDPSDAPA